MSISTAPSVLYGVILYSTLNSIVYTGLYIIKEKDIVKLE
jgi:hypothetical protein